MRARNRKIVSRHRFQNCATPIRFRGPKRKANELLLVLPMSEDGLAGFYSDFSVLNGSKGFRFGPSHWSSSMQYLDLRPSGSLQEAVPMTMRYPCSQILGAADGSSTAQVSRLLPWHIPRIFELMSEKICIHVVDFDEHVVRLRPASLL